MRKLQLVTILFFIFFAPDNILGQEGETLFARLRGLRDREIELFNVDGISIASYSSDVEFSAPKGVEALTVLMRRYNEFADIFSKLNPQKLEAELTTPDKELPFRNYHIYKSKEHPSNFFRNTAYYFVESPDKKMIVIAFDYLNKRDKAFERDFVTKIYNRRIPESVYANKSAVVSSIDFAGRTISLPLRYFSKWKGANNLQTLADGQMNWGIHKDPEGALETLNNQYLLTSWQEDTKIVSDTTVQVVFEGVETTARKVVCRATGTLGILLRKNGGSDTLNIYYVAALVRRNYVSCVMSYWESDYIGLSGLPFLLEQVMTLASME